MVPLVTEFSIFDRNFHPGDNFGTRKLVIGPIPKLNQSRVVIPGHADDTPPAVLVLVFELSVCTNQRFEY